MNVHGVGKKYMKNERSPDRSMFNKHSPLKISSKIKHSASKGELSTQYSKRVVHTARNLVKGNSTIEYSKGRARESMNHLNSPK